MQVWSRNAHAAHVEREQLCETQAAQERLTAVEFELEEERKKELEWQRREKMAEITRLREREREQSLCAKVEDLQKQLQEAITKSSEKDMLVEELCTDLKLLQAARQAEQGQKKKWEEEKAQCEAKGLALEKAINISRKRAAQVEQECESKIRTIKQAANATAEDLRTQIRSLMEQVSGDPLDWHVYGLAYGRKTDLIVSVKICIHEICICACVMNGLIFRGNRTRSGLSAKRSGSRNCRSNSRLRTAGSISCKKR